MMNGKAATPQSQGWVKLPRHVVERMLAARLSLAAVRLVHFLMREHLRHGGKDNGLLQAPHRQLVAIGISAGLVASAILELEAARLIHCHRRGSRVSNLFELTWLPRSSKSAALHLPPHAEADLPPRPATKLPPRTNADLINLPPDTEAELPPETKAEGRICHLLRRQIGQKSAT
jgi:hypothetical protein